MKPKFKSPPPGTIRGPFICGKGTDPQGGIQYAVKLKGEALWGYVIMTRNQQAEALREAERMAQREAAK